MTKAQFRDLTAVNAPDRVVPRFRHQGRAVEIVGRHAASRTRVERPGSHDRPGAALAGTAAGG
ncbi:hypothetical protein [Methylobacterium planeticum]|uniref:Uncharacterized protein n=1 Tax=Methylobacterium planeticum TaxID=2615211 RepID=A0A6N6MYA2_9HYPH|nr:hypothetical protein [Methylobacterium planeticum]KAB1075123.1 hypothetical protein F6X51_04345 [Methylobacterium planeticum]